MKDFFLQLKLRKPEFLQLLAVIAGSYAAGALLSVVLCRLGVIGTGIEGAESCDGAALGGFFAAIMFLCVYAIGMLFSFMQDFNVAIGMGRTRKRFLSGWIAATVSELAASFVCFELFGVLEKALLHMAMPGMTIDLALVDLVKWYHLAGVGFALLVWVLFGGALVLRYGMRILWVFWAALMIISIVPANLAENEAVQRYLASGGFISGGIFTARALATAGIVLGIALLAVALRLLGRQKVTV